MSCVALARDKLNFWSNKICSIYLFGESLNVLCIALHQWMFVCANDQDKQMNIHLLIRAKPKMSGLSTNMSMTLLENEHKGEAGAYRKEKIESLDTAFSCAPTVMLIYFGNFIINSA